VKTILFVCGGNIHRSVIAASYAEKLIVKHGLNENYSILSRGLQGSSGTVPPKFQNLRDYSVEWAFSEPILNELEIVIPLTQVATPVTRDVVEKANLILAMDSDVLRGRVNSLMRQFPDLSHKMRLLSVVGGTEEDVPDPVGQGIATHRRAIEMIHRTLTNHFDELLRLA
jgi:protein-tyrosine-phosphatase